MSFFADDAAPVLIIEDFKAVRKNTLRGFARVRLPSGLILEDVSIHRGDDGVWVGMPSKPMLDANGSAIRDERGKIKYLNLVNFTTRSKRDALSQQIIAAMNAKFPDIFDDDAA